MSDSDNKVLQVKEAIDRGAYESADVMDDASLDRALDDATKATPKPMTDAEMDEAMQALCESDK